MRWVDGIGKMAGPSWIQIVQDRESLNSLEDAFTRGGVHAKK